MWAGRLQSFAAGSVFLGGSFLAHAIGDGMSEPYSELDTALLEALLTKQRANLAFLVDQAAGFGTLYVPLHINNQLKIPRPQLLRSSQE